MLNEDLIVSRGIPAEDREEILNIHDQLKEINSNMDFYVQALGHSGVVELVEHLEFELQFLWGFEENADYHSHWFRITGCTCPKDDNFEKVGTGRRWISKSCPFHGG